VKVKFYGNAPVGFYKYKYPKKLCEQGSYGAKIFYLDHDELEKVLPNGIRESISQFMLFT